MDIAEIIPQLFRTEYRKIVAVLCKHFGFDQIEIAEDIASDTFLTAAETWGQKGLPPNPAAWLYTVAGNRAKNWLKRGQLFNTKLAPRRAAAPRQQTIPNPSSLRRISTTASCG
ncbi:sigma factor [Puia sp. P3]|uniref:sigma factor n=1 Tax=Puia sp. P3 TaxID=3423952 RepID=UPI003D671E77